MKKISKIGGVFVVGLLVVIELSSLFLMYKSLNNKNDDLATVKFNENFNNDMMFAIMIEQSDGTYLEQENSTWPTDKVYNEELSGCIDLNGEEIEGVLTFDSVNNIATVDTGNTSYCYLYFDMKEN